LRKIENWTEWLQFERDTTFSPVTAYLSPVRPAQIHNIIKPPLVVELQQWYLSVLVLFFLSEVGY